MADWELTATTIYCEAVDDEVTLLLSADGTCRCTGRQKYERPGKEAARSMQSKGRRLGRTLGCSPAECDIIVRYRKTMLGEEEPAR
jgi:hypothetical protein